MLARGEGKAFASAAPTSTDSKPGPEDGLHDPSGGNLHQAGGGSFSSKLLE